MALLMLKVLIMLRPADLSVVWVSMFPLEPLATMRVSGLDLEVRMARVGWVPWLFMPVMIALPAPTLPATASYEYAVTLARLDVNSVLPSALSAMPWFVCSRPRASSQYIPPRPVTRHERPHEHRRGRTHAPVAEQGRAALDADRVGAGLEDEPADGAAAALGDEEVPLRVEDHVPRGGQARGDDGRLVARPHLGREPARHGRAALRPHGGGSQEDEQEGNYARLEKRHGEVRIGR